MKKLINKNNIIIGVIVLILCSGLTTIFILGNKKDSSLDKHFSNDVNESNETIAKFLKQRLMQKLIRQLLQKTMIMITKIFLVPLVLGFKLPLAG